MDVVKRVVIDVVTITFCVGWVKVSGRVLRVSLSEGRVDNLVVIFDLVVTFEVGFGISLVGVGVRVGGRVGGFGVEMLEIFSGLFIVRVVAR